MLGSNSKIMDCKTNANLSLEIASLESWHATSDEVSDLLIQVKKASLHKTHKLKEKYSKYKQMARTLAEILSAKDSKIEWLEEIVANKEKELDKMKSAVKNMSVILRNMIGQFKSGLDDTKQMIIQLAGIVKNDCTCSSFWFPNGTETKGRENKLQVTNFVTKGKLEREGKQEEKDVLYDNQNALPTLLSESGLCSKDELHEEQMSQEDIKITDKTAQISYKFKDVLAADNSFRSTDAETVSNNLILTHQYPSSFLRKQQYLNQQQNLNRFMEGSESSGFRRSSSIASQSLFALENMEKSKTFDQKSSQNSTLNSIIQNTNNKQLNSFITARRHKSDDFSNSSAAFLQPLKRSPIVYLHSQSLPQQNSPEPPNAKQKRAVFPIIHDLTQYNRQSSGSLIDYSYRLAKRASLKNSPSSVSSSSQSPSSLHPQPISRNNLCANTFNWHNKMTTRSCNGSVSGRNTPASTGSKWGALFAELSQLSISELKRQAFKDKPSNQNSPKHQQKELRSSIYKTAKQSFSEVVPLLQFSEISQDFAQQQQEPK